jgi:hypothetical protein
MDRVWVSWTTVSRDPYGLRPGLAHAAVRGVRAGDVRSGSFPLACGRWAPDGWDASVSVSTYGRRCKRCEAVVRKESG